MKGESARRSTGGSVALRLVAVCAVSLLVAGSAVAGAAPAVASSTSAGVDSTPADRQVDATAISSCTTITEPGKYVLVEDIENATETCIEIKTGRVQFDGGGHTIDGTDSMFVRRTGVRVTGAENVTVTDLTVTDFAFAGVYYRGVSGGQIENVTAISNRFGITARTSSWLRIAESTVVNNTGGIDLSTTRRSVVVDNVVRDNRIGISLTVTTKHVRVARNEVRNNRVGVAVESSFSNVVTANFFCGNEEAITTPNIVERNEYEDNRWCRGA